MTADPLSLVLQNIDPELIADQAVQRFRHATSVDDADPDSGLAELSALAVQAGVMFAFQAFCAAIELAASTVLHEP